jgi:hypothetical protein
MGRMSFVSFSELAAGEDATGVRENDSSGSRIASDCNHRPPAIVQLLQTALNAYRLQ